MLAPLSPWIDHYPVPTRRVAPKVARSSHVVILFPFLVKRERKLPGFWRLLFRNEDTDHQEGPLSLSQPPRRILFITSLNYLIIQEIKTKPFYIPRTLRFSSAFLEISTESEKNQDLRYFRKKLPTSQLSFLTWRPTFSSIFFTTTPLNGKRHRLYARS